MQSRAGQTAGSGGLKFAHDRDDVAGQCLVEERVHWGARRVRGACEKNGNFPVVLTGGESGAKCAENEKKCQTRVQSRDDSSAAMGPIGTGSTRVGRELIGLANDVRVG